MVDLARTEAEMLAEIGIDTSEAVAEGPGPNAAWRLVGRTPSSLLPALTKRFCRCYAHVADEHVAYDLITVVKKGLGNAYRWGNEQDEEKLLVVTTTMTGLGAVIKISDQGNGFDVPRFIRDRVFHRKGSGLYRFQKTSSIISYADGGRTLLICFLCDAKAEKSTAGTPITPASATAASSYRIDLRDLRLCDQVKVKGSLEPNGNFLAAKVTRKPLEELAVIEAPLQQAPNGHGRVIRLLNLNVTLSEQTGITDADLSPAGFGALKAGQVVWLSGRYVPGEGFAPGRVKIRRGQSDYTVQGRVEEIDYGRKMFRVAGITVVTDGDTEVKDGVHAKGETHKI
jgi:hypothetical protein